MSKSRKEILTKHGVDLEGYTEYKLSCIEAAMNEYAYEIAALQSKDSGASQCISPTASQAGEKDEKKYFDGLTKHYGKTLPYQYNGPKCVSECKNYPHYETKHHPTCPFYPGSLSEHYDSSPAPVTDEGEEEWLLKYCDNYKPGDFTWGQVIDILKHWQSLRTQQPIDDSGEETPNAWCGKCGAKMQIVRPGKHQCPNCE